MSQHVELLVEFRCGRAILETVHAERLDNGHYKLLHSPGLVQGIAAGDEFRFVDENGAFEVVSRGGNVAVQVYAQAGVELFAEELERAVREVAGVLDGVVTRGIVFTIPASAGFETIERLFNRFARDNAGMEWMYGNVYADAEGKVPLKWWKANSRQ